MKFTVAGSVYVCERRSSRNKTLGIGDALGGTEYLEELVTLSSDTAKETELLKDHGPRNQGEQQQKEQDDPSYPASLCKNFKDIADEYGAEKKNWKSPSVRQEFSHPRNVAYG